MTTYRQQQPAPIEAGWYYGVNLPDNRQIATVDDGRIVPVYVDDSVRVPTRDEMMPVSAWRWFGSVPECREG